MIRRLYFCATYLIFVQVPIFVQSLLLMSLLRRYWFEFEIAEADLQKFGYWPAGGGVGITAYDYEDALKLLRRWIARGDELPKMNKVIKNADLSELFPIGTRLRQQLGCPVWRGVWHPAINLWYGQDLEP